ncbi:MAG: hypothetical protein U0996_01880 [Planctomycetaceae bacterium]
MYRSLDPEKTIATLRTLANRIEERFPGASLCGVCRELLQIAEETRGRVEWISRGHAWIRAGVIAVIGIAIYLGWYVIRRIKFHADGMSLEELEAGTNGLVLLGAALFFLITLESRIKRLRILRSLHELRALSHVIDMHQLTKDPSQIVARSGHRTPSSPQRTLTPFQLTRYLDYCSEMLSLVGKLAALYAQSTSDGVVLQSVNDIETLTNGISRKIWQKIMILDDDLSLNPNEEPPAAVSADEPAELRDPESGNPPPKPVTRRPLTEPSG